MSAFTCDIVFHRRGAENRYLAVTRRAGQVFGVLPLTLGVPCAGAAWDGAALVAPAAAHADVARVFLRDFRLTVGEALPEPEDRSCFAVASGPGH